jgi:hypothetical protein
MWASYELHVPLTLFSVDGSRGTCWIAGRVEGGYCSVKVTAFWDIAPCCLIEVDFRNVGLLQRNYTALYSRKLSSSKLPP